MSVSFEMFCFPHIDSNANGIEKFVFVIKRRKPDSKTILLLQVIGILNVPSVGTICIVVGFVVLQQ